MKYNSVGAGLLFTGLSLLNATSAYPNGQSALVGAEVSAPNTDNWRNGDIRNTIKYEAFVQEILAGEDTGKENPVRKALKKGLRNYLVGKIGKVADLDSESTTKGLNAGITQIREYLGIAKDVDAPADVAFRAVTSGANSAGTFDSTGQFRFYSPSLKGKAVNFEVMGSDGKSKSISIVLPETVEFSLGYNDGRKDLFSIVMGTYRGGAQDGRDAKGVDLEGYWSSGKGKDLLASYHEKLTNGKEITNEQKAGLKAITQDLPAGTGNNIADLLVDTAFGAKLTGANGGQGSNPRGVLPPVASPGSPRDTYDLDSLIRATSENERTLREALAKKDGKAARDALNKILGNFAKPEYQDANKEIKFADDFRKVSLPSYDAAIKALETHSPAPAAQGQTGVVAAVPATAPRKDTGGNGGSTPFFETTGGKIVSHTLAAGLGYLLGDSGSEGEDRIIYVDRVVERPVPGVPPRAFPGARGRPNFTGGSRGPGDNGSFPSGSVFFNRAR